MKKNFWFINICCYGLCSMLENHLFSLVAESISAEAINIVKLSGLREEKT